MMAPFPHLVQCVPQPDVRCNLFPVMNARLAAEGFRAEPDHLGPAAIAMADGTAQDVDGLESQAVT